MLDLGSVSFYDNQPKVSTAKFPPPAMDFTNRPAARKQQKSLHNWSFNNPEETSESFLDESIFHSHQKKLHPLPPISKQKLTSQNHSILTESVLPIQHNKITKPHPPPNDDSFLTESIFHSHVKPSKPPPFHVRTGSLLTDSESIFPDNHSSKPVVQHSVNNDGTLLTESIFRPYKTKPLQADNEILTKKPRPQSHLDDICDGKRQRSLAGLENKSSFQWEDINWYNKQKPATHQLRNEARYDHTVYKKKKKNPIYDREVGIYMYMH